MLRKYIEGREAAPWWIKKRVGCYIISHGATRTPSASVRTIGATTDPNCWLTVENAICSGAAPAEVVLFRRCVCWMPAVTA
jgi:hypothetical protein